DFARPQAMLSSARITRAEHPHVHRIPLPTSVTIAIRPSCGGGTARTIRLICVSEKEKYLCTEVLTRFLKISPSGKSPLKRVLGSCCTRLASGPVPGRPPGLEPFPTKPMVVPRLSCYTDSGFET